MKTKRCSTCNEDKPASKFNIRRAVPDGLQYRCKDCAAAAHRSKCEEDSAYSRRRTVKQQFGLSLEDYEIMMEKPCAICGNASYGLDHDHATGKVRAALCHPCNIMLGGARDNIAILRAGIKYLEVHRAT